MYFSHGVAYPIEFLELPLRDGLLRLSQSDQTRDAVQGEQYAAAAYDKAHITAETEDDDTAAGEALAKLAFRGAQLGRPLEVTEERLDQSLAELEDDEPDVIRETIATNLLGGRSTDLWERHEGESRGYPKS